MSDSIIRVKKEEKYFIASNEPFNDSSLSWGARGLIGYLLSKPNDWEVRNADLYRQSEDSKYKVDGYLKELQKSGYMRRYRVSEGKGKVRWITEIYESKKLNPDFSITGISNIEKSTVEKSTVETYADIVSTESLNTESTKNEIKHSPNGQQPKEKKPRQKTERNIHMDSYMDTFIKETGIPIPTRNKDLGFWWSSIGEYYAIFNQAGLRIDQGQAIIKEAIARLRSDKLTISGPNSLLKTIRAIIGERQQKPQSSVPHGLNVEAYQKFIQNEKDLSQ